MKAESLLIFCVGVSWQVPITTPVIIYIAQTTLNTDEIREFLNLKDNARQGIEQVQARFIVLSLMEAGSRLSVSIKAFLESNFNNLV